MAHILVVEDEEDVSSVIEYNLRAAGYTTSVAATAEQASRCLQEKKPDLLLLDLMLPDRPGTEVCRNVKTNVETRDVPVIIVSARAEEIDRVVGFELGADDYVTKPFSIRELLLRIRRTIVRAKPVTLDRPVLHSRPRLRLEDEFRKVWVDDAEVSLSSVEFRLLRTLVESEGRVMTRDALLLAVWGNRTVVSERTVDAHVKHLRAQLGAASRCIETVRGVGYRFAVVRIAQSF